MSIEIQDLSFSYGSRLILDKLNLTIQPSETLSILGPNGAGKTTFLNGVAGLLKPTSGHITYEKKEFHKLTPNQMALLVGYVPQLIVPSFDYSVLEYVVTGCAPQIGTFKKPGEEHYKIAREAIAETGITYLADKSYRQISGGERQQVSIARVIAQRPAYILMDEPTSHLDYGNQIRVLKTIKKLSKNGFGVVFTTHNPDHVLLLGGNVAVIDREGHLHYGKAELMINHQLLSRLYDTEICLIKPENSKRLVCFAPDLEQEGDNIHDKYSGGTAES